MHMLIDHKQDIGLRYVEKVKILKKGTGHGKVAFYHFFFILSEPRCASNPATVPFPLSESESESE